MIALSRDWGRMRRRYGIKRDEFLTLYHEQQGKCAICGVFSQDLVIDHNHSTNKIRGLLCSACNTCIGLARESPLILEKAIQYIEYHN